MTQICVLNTRLFSLHSTLNYAIHRACLRMVLLTDVYRNLTSLWIKPRERAFKQFKSPVLNVLSSRVKNISGLCNILYIINCPDTSHIFNLQNAGQRILAADYTFQCYYLTQEVDNYRLLRNRESLPGGAYRKLHNSPSKISGRKSSITDMKMYGSPKVSAMIWQ